MGLFNFEHDGRSRQFGYIVPLDWPDHYGDLSLVVCLHGGGQNIEQFADLIEVVRFYAGDFTGGAYPRVVMLFPQGLSPQSLVDGGWNTGIGPNQAIEDSDDAGFVVACIDRITTKLQADFSDAGEIEQDGQLLASPAGGPFRSVFCMGFSGGGNLTYRVASDNPGLFEAIAVVGSTAGGWRFGRDKEFESRKIEWGPALGPSITSVLHIHGTLDPKVPQQTGYGEDDLILATALLGSDVLLSILPYTLGQDDSLDLWLAPLGFTIGVDAPQWLQTGVIGPGAEESEWHDGSVLSIPSTGPVPPTVVVTPPQHRVRKVTLAVPHIWPDGATEYILTWFREFL